MDMECFPERQQSSGEQIYQNGAAASEKMPWSIFFFSPWPVISISIFGSILASKDAIQ